MKAIRKLMVVMIAIALMVTMVPMADVFAATDKLVILHTNDIHGRAEGSPAVDDEGNPATKGQIGYARYKTIIDREKAEVGEQNVMVLDAGDVVHGTNFATLSKGSNMIELMNMVGVHAMTCGNHEFNYGAEALKTLERAATFPIMGLNITKTEDGTNFFDVNSYVHQTAGGHKIGVIGVTTPETKVKADPRYTEGLGFGCGEQNNDPLPLAATINAKVTEMTDAGCTYMIVLAHVGTDEESVVRSDVVIANTQGVDLWIDGHSHEYIDGKIVKDKAGDDVTLVQAGEYFKNYGKVTVELDETGTGTAVSQIVPFADVVNVAEDQAIADKIETFKAENEAVLGQVIGETATELDGARGHVRTRETNLADLITDAMLRASGADVVLTNGGGIRESIPAGEVTMGQVMTVLPFGNLVTVIKVSGQDILDALVHGAQAYPATAGGFPQVAGMTYTIVTDVSGDEEVFKGIEHVTVGGEPLDPSATYTLATNDFMASGGDGYTMFGGKEQVTLLGLMLDITADYIRELSIDGPFDYKTDGRISVRQIQAEEPPVQPTEPPAEPTEPSEEPTAPPLEPTEPVSDIVEIPTDPPTQPPKPTEPGVPQTGEPTADMTLAFVLLIAAAFIAAKQRAIAKR